MNRRRFLSWVGLAPVVAAVAPTAFIGGDQATAVSKIAEGPLTPFEARYFFGDPSVAQRGGFLVPSDMGADFASIWRGFSKTDRLPPVLHGAPAEPA